VDTFVGTVSNDTFAADNTGTDTSSTADRLNGGDGDDTLNVFSDGAAGAMPALTSIETLNIYDQDADLNLATASVASVTSVSLTRGDGETALTVGANVATVGLTDIIVATGGNGLVVNAAAAATNLTLNLGGLTRAGAVDDEDVVVTGAALTTLSVNNTATSSFGKLDVASATTINLDASAALTITSMVAGATAASLNISGAGAVSLGTLDTAVNTITSTATGALTTAIGAAVDTVLTAGSGNDVITASTANTIATTDTLAVNGGDGTDTLVIAAAADVDSTADGGRYTNFETVRLSDSYDADYISGITAIQLAGATSKSYTDLTATQAANVQVRGSETSATFALKTATGTADVLSLTMGTGLTTSAATDITTGMTVTGFETINIAENGGATATAGANRTATVAAFSTPTTLNDINLTGRAVTLSDIATTVAVDIDGSALTGNGATGTAVQGLTVDGNAIAGSVITGSDVNDSFTVGAEGSTYNSGAGTDAFIATVALINADGATDLVLNGGAGTDTLTLSDTTTTLTDTHFTNLSGFETLALSNTAGDLSLTAASAFNAAFADGATVTTGTIANNQTVTVAAGLANVAMTITVDATSVDGGTGNGTSITTGSAADTVTFTGDDTYVGEATAAAQGTIVINTRGGDDTISVTIGTLDSALATGGQAMTITGGAGKDKITKVGVNDTVVLGTAYFTMAAGDSSTTAWDEITGFDAADGTLLSDVLNFEGTAVVSTFTATADFGSIKSHSLTAGYATFDDVTDYTSALVINSANVADVVGYLNANVAANGTVAFAYDSDSSGTADATMVFHQGSAASVADDLVMLVGVTSGSLHATLTTTASGTIGIA